MEKMKCLCIAQTQNQAAAILEMFRQGKINGTIVPTPQRFVEGRTCSYSVEFPSRYRAAATSIVRNNALNNAIVCI